MTALAATDSKPAVYSIPAENYAGLAEKIEKMNRKAAKLGVAPIAVNKVGEHTTPYIEVGPRQYQPVEGDIAQLPDHVQKMVFHVKYIDITVEGEHPHYAGWTFVATLQHVDGQVIIRTIPGYEQNLPVSFRSAIPENCDHCRTLRRRNDTYVVQHESGEYKQIGKQCLADFLGGLTPEALAQRLSFFKLLQDMSDCLEEFGGFGGGREIRRVSVLTWLTFVAAVIRNDGWLPRSKSVDMGPAPTADIAGALMLAVQSKGDRAYGFGDSQWDPKYQPNDRDTELATKTLDYVRSHLHTQDSTQLNDYLYNLSVATSLETIDRRLQGIVASAIAYYQRESGLAAERKAELERTKASQHVGTKGERIQQIPVTLLFTKSYENQFGPGWMHKFIDAQGNVLVWFGSNDLEGAAPGDKMTIAASVKDHSERDGVKQTIITRVTKWTEEGLKLEAEKQAKKAAREAKKAAKLAQQAK
jgi:hypothetical protein